MSWHVLVFKEASPSINSIFCPSEARCDFIFPDPGRFHRHRRHFCSGEPPSTSSLMKLLHTCPYPQLPFIKDPSFHDVITTPSMPHCLEPPLLDRLGSSLSSSTTPVSLPRCPCTHALPNFSHSHPGVTTPFHPYLWPRAPPACLGSPSSLSTIPVGSYSLMVAHAHLISLLLFSQRHCPLPSLHPATVCCCQPVLVLLKSCLHRL